MTCKALRAVAVVATLAFLFPVSGCIKMQEELIVFPDGSGKLTLTLGVSQAFIDKMKEMPGASDGFDEKAGLSSEDMDNAEGIVAFSKPVQEKKEGWVATTYTAYFEDINKVKLWSKEGEKKKLQLSFVFKPDGEGHVLEVDDRFTADDETDKMGEMPEEAKDQIWDQVKPMLKGFEISKAVKMPGTVTSVEGYATKSGRQASNKITEDAIKSLEDMGKTMKAAKRKVVCGKSEVPDADLAAFKKELAEAKSAWPKVKEEMKAEEEKKKKEKSE